jgi:DNA-directed RNA polymerase subunit alpha
MEPEEEESRIPDRIAEANIEDLDLSVRAFNCLKRAGITKVGEIVEKLARDEDELLSIRNFGQKSLEELKEKLEAKGYWPLEME